MAYPKPQSLIGYDIIAKNAKLIIKKNNSLNFMEEVRKLRQERAELEKENDFLKKAAAFFAKEID